MPNPTLAKIRVGPAGWDYKDWSGVVYPKPKPRSFDPLRYLARYFDTLEVNSTFYRPMSREVALAWAARVSVNPRFRFTAKLWRRFTHERDAAWSKDEVKQARGAFDALASEERLGAVLVQFPWSFRFNEENHSWLSDVLSELNELPLVVEVRHQSWNVPQVYEELVERGVGFVNIDQPLFRHSLRPSAKVTSAVGYVRVHGRNYREWFLKNAPTSARYDYLYSADELVDWVKRTRQIAQDPRTEEVYLVTNNHYLGKAPANALMLRSMLERRRVDAPDTLFRTYEPLLSRFAVGQAQGTLPLTPSPTVGR
jgi:uncharacterized protein YecE (DUF72 family)